MYTAAVALTIGSTVISSVRKESHRPTIEEGKALPRVFIVWCVCMGFCLHMQHSGSCWKQVENYSASCDVQKLGEETECSGSRVETWKSAISAVRQNCVILLAALDSTCSPIFCTEREMSKAFGLDGKWAHVTIHGYLVLSSVDRIWHGSRLGPL